MLENAQDERIYCHKTISTAYACLKDTHEYPIGHWSIVLEKNPRMRVADWITGKTLETISQQSIELFSFSLDMGESEVLALYYETPNSIVVIDEEKARKLARE